MAENLIARFAQLHLRKTNRTLALETRIAESKVSEILTGKKPGSPEERQALAKALGLPSDVVFNEKLLQANASVQAQALATALSTAEGLNEADRELLAKEFVLAGRADRSSVVDVIRGH